MASQHDFKGKTIALAGRFKHTRASFAKELEALGARTTKSVSNKTDYLILGSQTQGVSTTRATLVGAIILTEEEARAVMRGEQIDTPTIDEGGEQSLDDLLGEARSLLAQPPDVHVWRALTLLFDACTIEQHAALAEYIHAHTSKWSASQMAHQHGHEVIEEDNDITSHTNASAMKAWMIKERKALFWGELRVASLAWKGELFQEVDSPKFTLIKAISLNTNSRAITTALSSPHLINLTRLDLCAQLSPTLQLIKALCNFAWLPNLTHFRLGSINLKAASYLRDHTEAGSLSVLDLSDLYYKDWNRDAEFHDMFLKTPWFQTIEELSIPCVNDRTRDLASKAVAQDAFSKLHTVHIADDRRLRGFDLAKLIATGLLDRVTTLGIGEVNLDPKHLDDYWEGLWCKSIPEHISTIDARRIEIKEDVSDADFERAVQIMSDGLLLRHVRTLRLGEWLDEPRLVEPLEKLCPELELTP